MNQQNEMFEQEEASGNNADQQIISLTKAQQQAIPMARNEKEGIAGTPAVKANVQDLRNTIKVGVLKAYIANKKPYQKMEMTFLIDQLRDEVLRAYPGIRLEELLLAIHKFSMGEYGVVYGLSLAGFVGAIRQYMQSEARLSAVKGLASRQAQLLLEAPKQTNEERLAAGRKIALDAFDRFKATKSFRDYGNYVFHNLHELGVINFTEEQKIDILLRAKANVIKQLTSPSRTVDERNEKKRDLEAVQVAVNCEHVLIYIEGKNLGLHDFFNSLIEMDTELVDLLDT